MKAEDRFVERLRAVLPGGTSGRVRIGPGDDAAVIERPAGPVVATTDMCVEGVDFLPEEDPYGVGRRTMAVNLSDLAAMGAKPEWFLLAVAFPRSRGEDFPLAVARGALSRADPLKVDLAGGDLSEAPVAVIEISLFGSLQAAPLTRSGARPGDAIFLSGWPGRAAAGLRLARRLSVFASRGSAPTPRFVGLSPNDQRELLAAYRDPEPRVTLGTWLAEKHLATAAIDVSDGLGLDAGRIARASGVRLVLERENVPVHPSLATFADLEGLDAIDWILSGGDDYELLFTVSSGTSELLTEAAAKTGVDVRRIGRVEAGDGAVLRDRHGDRDVSEMGHDHLESGAAEERR
ncbi:MAG TPA: thiamine-phosphate kinase [Thermoanaerobaculia bacterium]|nr:thiamine-phosphate kinase [Thermoanaerobaculia bacterium]